MNDPYNITLQGLTQHQKALLDIIWKFGDLEEFAIWYQTLDVQSQKEVSMLQELVLLAYIDNMVEAGDLAEAREALDKISRSGA